MAFHQRHPLLPAAVAALVSFMVCSSIPVWTVWHLNSWEGVGDRGTLWGVLRALPNNIAWGDGQELFSLHRNNLILFAFVAAVDDDWCDHLFPPAGSLSTATPSGFRGIVG
jgi:hypothetical protein